MRYRTLGRTGLRVSEVGFGCGNVGGLLVRGSRQEQTEAVARALTAGINYFDTAPAYGNGKSETNLGLVLGDLRPEVIVATKVGLNADDMKDVRSAVKASLETSLGRLGRERVDVLQLHTPITMRRGDSEGRWSLGIDDVLGPNGVADAFESVRSRGLVRFLGFTGLGDGDALKLAVTSGRFDVVQAYYNLLNPTAGIDMSIFSGQNFGGLVNLASGQNMGVVVIRVMAGGALGGREARTGYASPSVGGALAGGGDYGMDETRASKLGFLLEGDITRLSQAAVRFALMHEGVSTVLVGFSSMTQIDEAIACSAAGPIPESAMKRLMAFWEADIGT